MYVSSFFTVAYHVVFYVLIKADFTCAQSVETFKCCGRKAVPFCGVISTTDRSY